MASTRRLMLLDEVAVDGTGAAYNWYSSGEGTLQIFGTWDGATVTLQGSSDGVNYTSLIGGAFTADVITEFSAGQIQVRAVVSGAGASTELTCILTPEARGL